MNRLRKGQVSHRILFLQLPQSFHGTVMKKIKKKLEISDICASVYVHKYLNL